MRRTVSRIIALGAAILAVIWGGCSMQGTAKPEKIDYPTKPITIIVPFSAGGSMDLQARGLERLAVKYLGQPFVVLDKPGGGGTIGWNELAGSAPDGYTLGITGNDLLLQPLYGETRYHYPTALDPLAQISSTPYVMVVNASSPWKSVADVVRYAKQHPHALKMGNSGIGSTPHILNAVFASLTGIQVEQVPFRGASESAAALLGNHIQIYIANPTPVKEQVKAGKLRVLAVSSEQRLTDPVFAQAPTFKEQGVDLVLTDWIGIAAPKELPPAVKAKLEAGLKKMILDPAFKEILHHLSLQPDYLDAQATQRVWSDDLRKLEKVITETGVLKQVKAQRGMN